MDAERELGCHSITCKMCMTRDVGTRGTLFGGNMMAWLDEAGAIFARNYTGHPHLVTVQFSELVFKYPVRVGEIVRFVAVEPKVGRTSISFGLVGLVEDREVIHTHCTFVALGEDGKPAEIARRGE